MLQKDHHLPQKATAAIIIFTHVRSQPCPPFSTGGRQSFYDKFIRFSEFIRNAHYKTSMVHFQTEQGVLPRL
ncbi:unnamed protein product [Chondrus crispus]|uniref:Uncharacterized protein n=1 Tax=Chondrus crispus TaxID=2769 RepID=R7Q9V5_CHOCR|nr:unnamed protein product [Chondrus crispus]CDF34181.1 unnamed protein product [Chondrus crispus]|eukprot:XP_005714000.1 unnamed protein product [Chondrus crispus]